MRPREGADAGPRGAGTRQADVEDHRRGQVEVDRLGHARCNERGIAVRNRDRDELVWLCLGGGYGQAAPPTRIFKPLLAAKEPRNGPFATISKP